MKRLALSALAIILFIIPVLLTVFVHKNIGDGPKPIDPNNLTDNYDNTVTKGEFHGGNYSIPPKDIYDIYADKSDTNIDVNVLGSSSEKKVKRIEVDLTNQKLYAFEGNKKKYSFSISSGKWFPTPTGEFRIWIKLKYANMKGGSKDIGTYYDLPNVPYTMYFYNQNVDKTKGFGIHGTYWHSNFGHPMSHGCINMKTEEAKVLYDWARSEMQNGEGTKVIIYGNAPNN